MRGCVCKGVREREREKSERDSHYSPIPVLVCGLLEPVHADTADSLFEMAGQRWVGPVKVVEESVERLESHQSQFDCIRTLTVQQRRRERACSYSTELVCIS